MTNFVASDVPSQFTPQHVALLEQLFESQPITAVFGTNSSCQFYCTGTADELVINEAIYWVNSLGGGKVHGKRGTYNCAGDVNHKSNVILEGEGEATSLVFTTTGTEIQVRGQNNWKILNLKVDSSGKSSGFDGLGRSFEHCIQMYNVQNFEIAGCHIEAYGFGIFIGSITAGTFTNQATKNGLIHHNYIHGRCGNDLIGGGPNGDSDPDTEDIIVSENYIAQEYGITAGTYANALDMVGVKRVKFINNLVYGSILFGNERDPNEYSEISHNIVKPIISGPATQGAKIAVTDDSNSGDVSSKMIVDTNIVYGGGIEVRGLSSQHINGVIVSNNVVNNVAAYTSYQQSGVLLVYADNCLISGNRLYGNTSTNEGIYFNNSTNNTVVNNDVDGYTLGYNGTGTVTGNTISGGSVTNCSTATIGSTVLNGTGNTVVNVGGINPDNLLYAQGNITGATTFDRKNGDVITATLTENITVTLNTIRVPKGSRLTLILTQDSTGSRTVTWPSTFKKAGGALALTSGAGDAVDVIRMQYDGTNWREISRALNQS